MVIDVNAFSERKVGRVLEAAEAGQAPVFLKGLKDLEVMDGSQVTMMVEVTGKDFFLVPWPWLTSPRIA